MSAKLLVAVAAVAAAAAAAVVVVVVVVVPRGEPSHSTHTSPSPPQAIASVLAAQYRRLVEAGWAVSAADVERDVGLLFGGAFEAFLAK